MSFRGRSRGTAVPRTSQIFKKRHDLINVDIPINADATLLGTITMQETGTIYAIKLSLHCFAEAPATTDAQRVMIWVRCVPDGTALPDLTDNGQMDTLNGFPAALLMGLATNGIAAASYLNEKFRFRRKCDDNSLIQLIGQHTNTQGTGRVCNITGLMEAIIRVR